MGEYPERIHTNTSRRRARIRRPPTLRVGNRPGFSLLEIMVVVSILSLLLTIAIPNWVRARTNANSKACARNLRTIQAVKEQYGMLNKLPASAAFTFADLIAEGLLSQQPTCPEGFSYTLGPLAADPICTSGDPEHVVNP